MSRIHDYLLERRIKKLHREYLAALRNGKPMLARAIGRDIAVAIKARSPRAWARIEAKRLSRMDPHERAVVQRESRA